MQVDCGIGQVGVEEGMELCIGGGQTGESRGGELGLGCYQGSGKC